MKEASRGVDGSIRPDGIAIDPLERLVNSVGISEYVVSRFPIGMLICGAEPSDPEGCGISKRAAEVHGRGPRPCSGSERIYNGAWIIAKKLLGHGCVIRPGVCTAV